MPRSGIRPLCKCGQPCRTNGRTKSGLKLWDRYCWKCRDNGYRKHKKDYCEECGFKAIHAVQLDVDHIDGNHNNDDVSNLMTLCANCHRLKTQMNNDHLPNRGEITIINNGQLELNL